MADGTTEHLVGRREATLGAVLVAISNRYDKVLGELPTGEEEVVLLPSQVEHLVRELRDLAGLALGASEELADLACEVTGEEPCVWPSDLNAASALERGGR